MTVTYIPNSSLSVTHEIHTDLAFNRIIDTPALKTDRTCVFTMSDTREVTDTYNKWLGAVTVVENCVIEKSTILYYDTIENVYIWRHEVFELVFTLSNFVTPSFSFIRGTTDGVYNNYGGLPTKAGGVSADCWWYKVPTQLITCTETIYARTMQSDERQTLVSAHTYVKDAFAGNVPGSFIKCRDTVFSDGGNDFFYPLWIRNMTEDYLWAQAAKDRVMSGPSPAVGSSTTDIVPQSFYEDPKQIGSIVYDTKGDFIRSFVFSMHNPDGSPKRVIVNGSSIGDVLHMISKAGYSTATSYYPIGLI